MKVFNHFLGVDRMDKTQVASLRQQLLDHKAGILAQIA